MQAIDVDNTSVPPYRTATFYSYDVHGNADTVLHDYGAGTVMDIGGNRFKLIRYDYDLISGKVNMVSYQPHNSDGYYQQYRYDAENRLIAVKTSRDSILWQQDATYHYYRHGPLARMELGELKVQGVDYAYTVQGVLKGINSTSVGDGSYDMGEDGKANSLHNNIARDAFGMSIDYYTGDYVPVSSSVTPFTPAGVGSNLYNGNIKASIVNIPSLGNALAYAYQYDQLNRLVGMDAYTGLNSASNTFNPATNGDYRERLTYDPNGNILSYLRNGAGNQQLLNNYSYAYVTNRNQLQSITNSITQQTKTYAHDLIGNVTDDGMQGVQSGQWDVYNKLQSLQNKDGKTVTYTYDATGYRISKRVGNITEWYVKTTDGNILASYISGDNTKNNGALTQTEVHLYSSDELGIVNSSVNCTNLTVPLQAVFTRAEKVYQLTDYRQNVVAVVSDKRIQQSANNTTVDYSTADIISANYYSAYGAVSKTLLTPTLNGFNGQRKSSEITTTAQTAQFWEYNGDVGRRWNRDPVKKHYESPYVTFADNAIFLIDHNGDDTLKINGSNNSSITVSYGKGTAVHSFNLSDYHIKKDLGKININLSDEEPDVLGLDLGVGGSVPVASAGVGVNLLWHTRGEKKEDQNYPEVHTYTFGGITASSNKKDISGTAGLSFFWGYAETANPVTGKKEPAKPDWVANGFNWTGTFYSASVSLSGATWGGIGSKFTSLAPTTELAKGESMWSGYSIGLSYGKSSGGSLKAKNFVDILKNSSASFTAQNYFLIYGNGSDYLPKSKKNITGWHILNPIDPEDDK